MATVSHLQMTPISSSSRNQLNQNYGKGQEYEKCKHNLIWIEFFMACSDLMLPFSESSSSSALASAVASSSSTFESSGGWMGTYWVEPQIPRKLCDTKFVDSLCLAKYSVCLVAGGMARQSMKWGEMQFSYYENIWYNMGNWIPADDDETIPVPSSRRLKCLCSPNPIFG